MASRRLLALAALCSLEACTTSAQRKAAENAAIEKQAAEEVRRICALPEVEREAEVKKIKEDSGLSVYCTHP